MVAESSVSLYSLLKKRTDMNTEFQEAKVFYEELRGRLRRTSRLSPRWRKRYIAAERARVAVHKLSYEYAPSPSSMPTRTREFLYGWSLASACIGLVIFLLFLAIRDTVTLDPMPRGVKQHGTNFIAPLPQASGAAEPSRLCARLSNDDSSNESRWKVTKVVPLDNKILVKCAYLSY